MTALLSHDTARLVVVPGDDTNTVWVKSADASTGVLAIGRTDADDIRTPVFIRPDERVPDGVLTVSSALADETELDERGTWALSRETAVPLGRLTLEPLTERPVEHVLRELEETRLVGRMLWRDQADDAFLSVRGVPYRVRDADVVAGLTAITSSTVIELFSPGVRSGVDMVILADTSGSMHVEDLPSGERHIARTAFVSRIAALQDALKDLLRIRLQTSGRVSRIALVSFDDDVEVRFPVEGGMTELDGDSDDDLIARFEAEVKRLYWKRAGTNISNALVEASDLLYRYGHPGNDKVIVLVSDGAHWAPKDDNSAGELVFASEDPVSLMSHLSRDGDIRLHAIGISNQEYYQSWVRRGHEGHESLSPNHGLLEQLVQITDGDPATIGGLEVLRGYFSDLGAGLVSRVRQDPDEVRGARLDDRAEPFLRRAAAELGQADADVRGIMEVAGRVNSLANTVLGHPSFDRNGVKRTQDAFARGDSLETLLPNIARSLTPLEAVAGAPIFDSLKEALIVASRASDAASRLQGAMQIRVALDEIERDLRTGSKASTVDPLTSPMPPRIEGAATEPVLPTITYIE